MSYTDEEAMVRTSNRCDRRLRTLTDLLTDLLTCLRTSNRCDRRLRTRGSCRLRAMMRACVMVMAVGGWRRGVRCVCVCNDQLEALSATLRLPFPITTQPWPRPLDPITP